MQTNIVYSEKTTNSINSFKLDINSIEKFIINTVKKNKGDLLSQGEVILNEKYRDATCFGTFYVLNLKITQNNFDNYDVYAESFCKKFATSKDDNIWITVPEENTEGITVREHIRQLKEKQEQQDSSSDTEK